MFNHEVCGQLSLPNIRKTFPNSKLWTIICILCQRIGYSFDSEEDMGLKCESYLPSSSMSNIYVLIIKSQLSNDVNCNVKFQKMRIPLFMFYSIFPWGYHTNPKFAILRDFAEEWILEICQKVPSRENYGISFNVTPCKIKKCTSVSVHLPCLKFFWH